LSSDFVHWLTGYLFRPSDFGVQNLIPYVAQHPCTTLMLIGRVTSC